MAYRFVRTSNSWIEFSAAPVIGYTFGPLTWAIFFKANEVFSRELFTIRGAGDRAYFYNSSTDLGFASNGGASTSVGPTAALDTSSWILLVYTCAGTGSTPRYHIHKGTSWSHGNTSGALAASAIVSGDTIRLATRNVLSQTMSLDIVCAGIKKADSADLTVETLSRTAFGAWAGFGFDWLVGLDASFISGGVIQDQASPGTGDEVSRAAVTTGVSDPPGWSFATSATYNGSATVSLTATITTAGARVGAVVHGSATASLVATVTTVSRAVTLHASATVTETVTVTTRASLTRMVLVPRPPDSLVLIPRPPDSLVLTPR